MVINKKSKNEKKKEEKKTLRRKNYIQEEIQMTAIKKGKEKFESF